MSSGDWSGEELALLRSLWASGTSAGGISDALGKIGPGRSRNSVLGKAHRLNLTARESPIPGVTTGVARKSVPKPKPKPAPRVPFRAAAVPMIASAKPPQAAALPGAGDGAEAGNVAASAPTGLRRLLAGSMAPRATHRTCQWPLNDGYPWRFCGEPRWDGTRMPYCQAHARIARAKPGTGEDAA